MLLTSGLLNQVSIQISFSYTIGLVLSPGCTLRLLEQLFIPVSQLHSNEIESEGYSLEICIF